LKQSAVDEGGQAVVDLKKRAKILEDSLFDTEVDGVIVKGIATRLAEAETTIKQNAELAKRQAEDAETNSKKYVDENFIDISDIKAVKDDIPTNENKAREALGLEPIEIG
jgi:NACalpha-BTF3-like transcription factor